MSSKPLIPSKDALRVLRSLANSSPVALVGATGALCGVATIHYHEYRKLCRAEKILETKRKLHSITKGRGSVRLASMFEAAERGEDFTINRVSRTKAPKRNQHSLRVAEDEVEDNTEWKPFVSQSGKSTHTTSLDNNEFHHAIGTVVSTSRSSVQHTSDAPSSLRKLYRSSSVYDESEHSHKQSDWHSVTHSVRSDGLKERRQIQRRVAADLAQSPNWKPVDLFTNTVAEQPLTDLSPLLELSDDALRDQTAISDPSSIVLKTDSTRPVLANALSSLQPWHHSTITQDAADTELLVSQTIAGEPEHLDLYLASWSNIPSVKVNHKVVSRYDLSNDKIREGMSLIGTDRYSYVFTSLMNYREQNGNARALSLLGQIMERYTRTDSRPDWALVQALFLDCIRHFSTSEIKPLVWRFVEKFLQGDTPRLEVVSLLYPQCGAGKSVFKQQYYYLAHQYLEAIAANNPNHEQQVMELRKVLAGTRMCEIPLHEHLMIPALQSYCSARRMSSAQALFDEMTSVHKIHATFYSLRVLVKGYAQIGSWMKVKSILDKCYIDGLASQKLYGLSGLLHSVISDYSVSHPPEKVIDFVIHCIRQYRIEPVSGINREVISLCLRHRRYDLVVSWMNMIRTQFPHIDIGTDSTTFAFDISCVWREIDASCEDILEGCRALATFALRDPFSKVFRSMISEAASRYMEPRLQMLRTELGPDVPESPRGGVHDFHTTLKQLKDRAPTKVWDSRVRLVLMDLLHQCSCLRWLNALCYGHTDSTGADARRLRPLAQAETEIQEAQLPPATVLQEKLIREYTQRGKAGHSVSHNRLREIVSQLVRQNRLPDAYNLVQLIYESRWVQPPSGREFEIDLFTQWLKLAWDLRSGTKVRHVLWAIIDAGPQLELTSQIVLLARIAAPQTHLQRTKQAKEAHVHEVEYLRHRLRRRLLATKPEQLKLADWKGFGSNDPQYTVY